METSKISDQQDALYWQKFLQGSQIAFDYLYEKYFPVLFRYGMRFSSDRDLVKDCLQDLFVEIYTHRTTLAEASCVRHYLFTSFRRKIVRYNRQKGNKNVELTDGYHFEVTFSHEHMLILQQADDILKKKLQEAFCHLSHRQKEAIYLRFYEQMEYEDIAAVMEFKQVKYARTLIYRAITVLREAIHNKNGSLTLYAFFPFFFGLLSFQIQ